MLSRVKIKQRESHVFTVVTNILLLAVYQRLRGRPHYRLRGVRELNLTVVYSFTFERQVSNASLSVAIVVLI